ncbi:hypothetical protein Pan181_42460 [Aeoliella mucimassa]|uniref:Uncharacterized protein n=1 Tax=Aeoliella mucimassa TaxID=2527972 RepID=A0A518ATG9_9BACT|nr:hypothetical protein Pan181_42460 [Aeoliella mucimassa]
MAIEAVLLVLGLLLGFKVQSLHRHSVPHQRLAPDFLHSPHVFDVRGVWYQANARLIHIDIQLVDLLD